MLARVKDLSIQYLDGLLTRDEYASRLFLLLWSPAISQGSDEEWYEIATALRSIKSNDLAT